MTRPDEVRAEIRYVPGPSCRPWTRPAKRTRFRPAWPATLKRPLPRQAGDTWLTVKMTRPARGRTKVKVVVRRRFDPDVPIHGRDEWKWSTRSWLADDDDPVAEPPEPAPPLGPAEGSEPPEYAPLGDPLGAAIGVLVPVTWDSEDEAGD